MAALAYVDVPGYRALLFRRSFPDLNLPGALMDRAREWLGGSAARWNAHDHVWTFPSGASLTFGYLENEKDKYRYQSAELQYIGFDELTQFAESQYLYLFSRLRRLAGSAVPLRMRAASNPAASATSGYGRASSMRRPTVGASSSRPAWQTTRAWTATPTCTTSASSIP